MKKLMKISEKLKHNVFIVMNVIIVKLLMMNKFVTNVLIGYSKFLMKTTLISNIVNNNVLNSSMKNMMNSREALVSNVNLLVSIVTEKENVSPVPMGSTTKMETVN